MPEVLHCVQDDTSAIVVLSEALALSGSEGKDLDRRFPF